MEEFLRNLIFQALTNESDKVVVAFDKIEFLVIDLLEQFVKIEQELYKDSETLGENLDKTINQTDFDIEVAPEVEIKEDIVKFQSGEKKLPPEPKTKTTPLTTNEIEKNYEDEQKQYFETAITLNQTNIDTAIENAEESNKETILEMIDPTPGQVVIDTFNPNDQHLQSLQDDFTYKFLNQIQQKLTDILSEVKEKTKKINIMTPKPTEKIPNDPLSYENIETEDLYFEDDYFKPTEAKITFMPLSPNDRKDFEVNVSGDELIVFRSPILKTVNIGRKEFKKSLINIIEGNILTRRQHQAVSKLIEKTEKGRNSEEISKRINLKWMKNLLEEQLQKESDYYKIGKDFQKTKLRGNIKAGKRKLFHELDELDEIEELPSIFITIPTDQSKRIRAAQKVFDKVIKQVPSTDHKKI